MRAKQGAQQSPKRAEEKHPRELIWWRKGGSGESQRSSDLLANQRWQQLPHHTNQQCVQQFRVWNIVSPLLHGRRLQKIS